MKNRLSSVFVMLWVLVFSGTAIAQDVDPEAALLEADNAAAGLDGFGLEEKKEAPKKVLDDPDPKGLAAMEAKRAELENWVNTFQKKAQKFAKVDDSFNQVMGEMLQANDAFDSAHYKQVSAYRAALAEDRIKDKKKLAKSILKMRTKYLKKLKALKKRTAKVEKLFDKIAAKAAKEEAEDAAEAEGE